MTDPTPPPCIRCGGHIDDHERHETLTCGRYVWPGTLLAAVVDLDRALLAFFDELAKPFRALLRRLHG